MAFNDTLFQLGMDLTRSSTAQEEDRRTAAHVAHQTYAQVAHDDRKDFFIERDGVRFAGTHLIVDLFGARRLDDLEHIKTTLTRCVALDVFMCGEAKPQNCIEVLREAFNARDVVVKTHHRGSEMDDLKWQAAASKRAPVRLKSVKKTRKAA
jgi:S-adenosylmethionine decarboxylase